MLISEYFHCLVGRNLVKLGSKSNEGPYRITDVDGAGVHYQTEGGEEVVPWKSEASWKLVDILW